MTNIETIRLTREVEVFDMAKLPNIANCGSGQHRISVYRGVLILWDEDDDTRILDYIDELADHDRQDIAAVQEHKGSINVFLRYNFIKRHPTIFSGCGDAWSACYYTYDRQQGTWAEISN